MMVSGFQSQNMGQMQHAAMISQQAGMPTGEAMMGMGVNRAAAIGGPMAMGGMALAGVDPFSLAARGAMGGFRAAGIMGGIGGGLALGGIGAAGMMGAQYVGGQMMTGMNQQQQLNSMMRQSYQFMGQHGRGFTGGELGDMGQMMRQMGGQRGPGGEFASFDELSRMAANMSRMGMAQGVRSAKEFTDRFKQMITTVKEIATAFSTSLEQAQQVMGAMKSSGIFKNQGQVAQDIRGYAVGGGLATSEVTGMMNVGAQISRMVGGRGRAGAMGGMQTIGQIGLAQQIGTLSEEDIYNTTGLTGAEGRRAMATSMMQQSAEFMRGGLGRRFLASIAGKGGTLDESSANEWMYGGGMGTGRTMERAHQNLGRIGRADFIRNEGKLRGAALEKFGGLAHVMAMRGWLEERGMDLSGGDDRAMIFMQRRLGMGNDEAESTLKMIRDLPQMMRQREFATSRADEMGRVDRMRGRMGVQGVKKQFEEFRHSVQNKLQQAGADFYEAGSNMLERWVNQITGSFVAEMSADITREVEAVRQGGEGAATTLRTRFGIGGKQTFAGQLGDQMRGQIFGGQQRMGGLEAFKVSGDLDRYRQAGYNITAKSDAQLQTQLAAVQRMQGAFMEGAGRDVAGIGEQARTELRNQAAQGRFSRGRGTAALSDFGDYLQNAQDPGLRMLADRWKTMSREEQWRTMGSVQRGAGLGGLGGVMTAAPEQQSFAMSGFRTSADRDMAIGSALVGGGRGMAQAQETGGTLGKALGWGARIGAGFLIPGLGAAGALMPDFGLKDEVSNRVQSMFVQQRTGVGEREIAAGGRFLGSEEGMRLARGALSGEAGALGQIQDRAIALQSVVEPSEAQKGELRGLKAMQMAAELNELVKNGEDKVTDDQKRAFEKKYSLTVTDWNDAKQQAGTLAAVISEEQKRAFGQLVTRVQRQGAAEMASFRRGGVFREGALTAEARAAFGKVGKVEEWSKVALGFKMGVGTGGVTGKGISTGQQFMASMARAAEIEEGLGGMGEGEQAGALQQAGDIRAGGWGAFGRMSIPEQRALAEQMRLTGAPTGLQAEATRRTGMASRLTRAGGGPRGNMEIARQLGLGGKAKDLQGLGVDQLTSRFMSELSAGGEMTGAEREDLEKQLRGALTAQKEGKSTVAAGFLSQIQGGGVLQRKALAEQDESAKQNDPSFRKLDEMSQGIKELAKSLGKPLSVNVMNIKELKEGEEQPK